MIGLGMLVPQMASAAPKEKYKPIPPGQARKAATSRSYSGDRWYSNDRDRRYSRSYRDNDRYHSGYRYSRPSVSVYRNWDRRRVYSWNNNRYRWYGGAWVIYDASPRVVYTERVAGGSVVASVQSALGRRGYDAGPVDGAMGGRTRSAIYAFQADHGLARTGTINEPLLRALNLG